VKNVVMPFTQLLQPPPFAVEWCRVRVHELTVQIPQVTLAMVAVQNPRCSWVFNGNIIVFKGNIPYE
jgi:hypothetical protein